MGADAIAEIAPEIREVLDGGSPWCATFELAGVPEKWVQYTPGTINAAYPHLEHPSSRLASLGSFVVEEWEAGKVVTLQLLLEQRMPISQWIDRYFTEVLGCSDDYSLDTQLFRLPAV